MCGRAICCGCDAGFIWWRPGGTKPETCPVDPYLLAARMTDDAVLAYHTALEFHSRAYSMFEYFQYLTCHASRAMQFRSFRFNSIRHPKALLNRKKEMYGVKTMERSGLDIRVTSLERTMVDLLGRPELGGGWEEIWRSLEGVEFFDLELVIEYALLLGNATTTARVGFFLDQHRESLMVTEQHLDKLRKCIPKKPHYFERGKSGSLIKSWNLIVPIPVLKRSWQEAP